MQTLWRQKGGKAPAGGGARTILARDGIARTRADGRSRLECAPACVAKMRVCAGQAHDLSSNVRLTACRATCLKQLASAAHRLKKASSSFLAPDMSSSTKASLPDLKKAFVRPRRKSVRVRLKAVSSATQNSDGGSAWKRGGHSGLNCFSSAPGTTRQGWRARGRHGGCKTSAISSAARYA
eukprot:902334-Pleurochrysis_carterae.AAC.2